ncbi:MAG: FAD-binding oxidoreductase [Synechococcaceae cyanobacterium]
MIRPDPHELQELVRELHQQRTAWLPSGLGSRLHWGPPVAPDCQVLSAARLDRVLEHSVGDFTISVEAGLPLRHLQQHLERQRQWLALDWPWGGGSAAAGSIGGLVARGMAGGYRQRYYGVRDQVIGLKLMRADGTAAQAGGRVVKNVAGYDLMRLFTGSWGSLGLITELTLRTLPLPPCRRGLLLWGPLPQLAELVNRLLASSLTPERIDWWSPVLLQRLGSPIDPGTADAEAAVLVALASVDAPALEEQLGWIQQQTPLPARRLDADALAALLEALGTSTSDAVPSADGPPHRWLLRLGVRPDRVAELLALPTLRPLAVELAAGTGLGQAWAEATTLTPAAVADLRRRCRELGGELTVLLQPASSQLPAWEDAPSRPLIEAVKRAFDPRGQLAPGRLPGVAPAAARAAAQASSHR